MKRKKKEDGLRVYFRVLAFLGLALYLSVLAGCASVGSRMDVYGKGELNEKEYGLHSIIEDTVWSGRIRITGDVYVKEGVTLTVLPGTVIRFDTIEPKLEENGGRNMLGLDSPYFPGAEIIVRGRIIAVGTPDNPIVFTSSDKAAKPGAWGAINLLGSNGNLIENCRVYYAYNGVHNHAAGATVQNCVFSYNGTALSFKKADFENPCTMFIEHNRIVENKSGISARNSAATISFNDISDNEFYGIWIREGTDLRVAFNDIKGNGKGIYLYKAPQTRIGYNNILENKEYNMAMAEDNPDNVDATFNWWGTTDPKAIAATIFDKSADESLGRVVFQPMMDHVVAGTVK
jgi:copper-binding protein NosD